MDLMQFNESMLNITDTIIMHPSITRQYVTLDSCKAYAAQAVFWSYFYGTLFLIIFCVMCYILYKYLKEKKK